MAYARREAYRTLQFVDRPASHTTHQVPAHVSFCRTYNNPRTYNTSTCVRGRQASTRCVAAALLVFQSTRIIGTTNGYAHAKLPAALRDARPDSSPCAAVRANVRVRRAAVPSWRAAARGGAWPPSGGVPCAARRARQLGAGPRPRVRLRRGAALHRYRRGAEPRDEGKAGQSCVRPSDKVGKMRRSANTPSDLSRHSSPLPSRDGVQCSLW